MPCIQDGSGAQETARAANGPCTPKLNQSLGRWDPDFPASRRWMLGGAAGSQLSKQAPRTGTDTSKGLAPNGGLLGAEHIWKIWLSERAPSPGKPSSQPCWKSVTTSSTLKRQVFQMGKVRLSPSANSRTTQGVIAQTSNKNSCLSKHHAWTFFDPQIWMLCNRMSMWPVGLWWRVLCILNYTRRDKVPAIVEKKLIWKTEGNQMGEKHKLTAGISGIFFPPINCFQYFQIKISPIARG